MSTDVTSILRTTTLLGTVPAEDLNALAAASRLRGYRRGQIVFTRSDPGDTVIVVVSGRVKVTVRSADGGELTLAVIPPGGLLGELGVVLVVPLEAMSLGVVEVHVRGAVLLGHDVSLRSRVGWTASAVSISGWVGARQSFG